VTFDDHVNPLLAKYCTGCHGGARPRADLVLKFGDETEARDKAKADSEFWVRVYEELSAKHMPPAEARRRPTDDERALMVAWIETNQLTANGQPDPGPFMVHRLNNREYANTVRDLLYLPPTYDVVADFPADERRHAHHLAAARRALSRGGREGGRRGARARSHTCHAGA
jgi:hypothetical protein